MTADEIAELRALARAATPGPYRADGYDVLCPDDSDAPRGYTPHVYLAQDCTPGSAAYIAAACNAVPRLCDEIERLRADVERLTRQNDELFNDLGALATQRDGLRARLDVTTRELREARAALLCYAPKCFTCNQLATRGRVEFSGRYCDAHADPIHHDHQHAPAIRAAEGSE